MQIILNKKLNIFKFYRTTVNRLRFMREKNTEKHILFNYQTVSFCRISDSNRTFEAIRVSKYA